ncbi:alanine--tRNA ligase, partial [Bacteroidota bacterium]|nr:alanine--tRNA ligase [Bacteroidota bacterium]
VADKGLIKNKTEKIKILDVKKENNIVVHDVDQLPEDLANELVASVNIERRHLISINHTATHILHNVLRKNIGVHVQQKGSFLDENYLRFDFSNNDGIY